MWHVTVRMAWHDRGWDGTVCNNPVANTYCSGTHSLLSERIAREKRPDLENPIGKLDDAMPEYLPPCFWTSCAFSGHPTKVVHRHPFGKFREKKLIEGTLRPNSVYTWPFRLSITQSQNSHKRHGQYFPDLEQRIEKYLGRLTAGKSLIFFYLNYDNPISADDYKYAVVGFARLSSLELTGHFAFDKKELREIRQGDGMQNFPTLNWGIQLTHEGLGSFVRLPYQEYLAHIEQHPEDEPKLQEMRVLIEEPALLPGFKYVSEEINDDHSLALLYKLKRAFSAVQRHGIVAVESELELLDQYIQQTWTERGLYPGLGAVVSILADLAEGEPQKESSRGQGLVDAFRKQQFEEDGDLLNMAFAILESSEPVPKELAEHRATIRDARAGLRDNKILTQALRKLSLFSLTSRQVSRILYPDRGDGPHTFGGRNITPEEIAGNPYLLCENYVPATDLEKEQSEDLDREKRTDGPIDYLTIDIGMFPDRRYVERNDELHCLTVAGPERLRAFAVEALHHNEDLGHTFAPLGVLVDGAVAHPLFYRDSIALRPDQFLSETHLSHFRQRLCVREVEGHYYFYLQETKDAEEIVSRYVKNQLAATDLTVDIGWIASYLEAQVKTLKESIDGFDENNFKAERQRLLEGALKRRFYCVTGRPGSGKTQALMTVLDYLEQAGESATVLAPTGKAALRLNRRDGGDTKWKAETIDRWIFRSGLGDYLEGQSSLKEMRRSARYVTTDNLIIDEMSMVDLPHLSLLFRSLEVHQAGSIKRVILVGDENQLPPIGCGRPFHDITTYFREDVKREQRNLVRLKTNCRQQHDPVVLDAAHLFAGKNRYHTGLFERLLAGGQVSDFLRVDYWEDSNKLQDLIAEYVENVLNGAVPDRDELSSQEAFNKLLGLYDKGYVPRGETESLQLDRAQLLTPYRGGPSGGLGLSDFIRRRYRHDSWPERTYRNTAFAHSDKIIRIRNLYGWNKEEKHRELRLSNGSIGVLCNNKKERQAYFPESQWPLAWNRMKEEDFELAYGVTVHKAQGSEFQEVAVVVPERRALLSRELVYTALTRSKTKLTLLIQKTPRTNPLQVARERSVVLLRNSSVFADPIDTRRIFEPEPGVKVKSKIEYLIYRELQAARDSGKLSFGYEEALDLPIDGRRVVIHPDFTISCCGKTFYWEHLGMLDRQDYSREWRSRFAGYRSKGLSGALITTDDLGGVRRKRLQQVIEDLVTNKLTSDDDSQEISEHHYCL